MEPVVFNPDSKPNTAPVEPVAPATPVAQDPIVSMEAVVSTQTPQAPAPLPNPVTPPVPVETPQPVATPPTQASFSPADVSNAPIAPIPTAIPQPAQIQSPSFNSSKKSHKKTILLSVGGGVVVALVAVGVVFGYILPNRPENVWSNGLNRSGKALSALINSASQTKTLENFKKSDISATVSGNVQGESFNGTLGTKFDETGANGSLVIKTKADGQAEKDISLNFIGQVIKDQPLPTTYVQLNGLKALNLDEVVPGISNYDGKWITIGGDYYQKLGLGSLTSTQNNTLTASDISEFANTAASITAKRVFTANPKVGVFERRSFVGKETVDGISAFHYTVGINKANLVSYCKDLVDTEMKTNAFKKLPSYDSSTFTDNKKSAEKDCDDSVKDIKDTQTFDMWIDAKYKLVYKVRFTDDTNKNTYVDVGQKYKGGDDITLFTHAYEDPGKTDINFELKTNIKTQITSADLTVESKDDTPFNVKVNLNAKPFSGNINTKTPAGAIKLEDVLKQLGIDPAEFLGGSLSSGSSASSSSVN